MNPHPDYFKLDDGTPIDRREALWLLEELDRLQERASHRGWDALEFGAAIAGYSDGHADALNRKLGARVVPTTYMMDEEEP